MAIELYRRIDIHAISVLGYKLEKDMTRWGMINEHTKQMEIKIEIAHRKYIKFGFLLRHLVTNMSFITVSVNIVANAT